MSNDPEQHPPAFLSHLEEGLDHALRDLAAHERILVALDFDGVLAPLVDDPSTSRIEPAAVTALAQVAELPGVELAVVTGREAARLLTIAEVPAGTRVIGSHGAQSGRAQAGASGLAWAGDPVTLSTDEERLRTTLAEQVTALVADVEGAWLEEKPASVVVHTRRCTRAEGAALLERVLAGPATLPGARAQHGKDVIELSVLARTKGDGIVELRADTRAQAVLFAGDDVTDEDAFAVLEAQDVGIKVGPGESLAGYRIADPEQVAPVLLRLMELRTTTT